MGQLSLFSLGTMTIFSANTLKSVPPDPGSPHSVPSAVTQPKFSLQKREQWHIGGKIWNWLVGRGYSLLNSGAQYRNQHQVGCRNPPHCEGNLGTDYRFGRSRLAPKEMVQLGLGSWGLRGTNVNLPWRNPPIYQWKPSFTTAWICHLSLRCMDTRDFPLKRHPLQTLLTSISARGSITSVPKKKPTHTKRENCHSVSLHAVA